MQSHSAAPVVTGGTNRFFARSACALRIFRPKQLDCRKMSPGIAFTDKPAMIITLTEPLLSTLNEKAQPWRDTCGMPCPKPETSGRAKWEPTAGSIRISNHEEEVVDGDYMRDVKRTQIVATGGPSCALPGMRNSCSRGGRLLPAQFFPWHP